MPEVIDPVAAERLARHGFIDPPTRTVADAARLTTAIQAQDAQASRLGLRSRAQGFTDAEVLRAIDIDRTVARSWLMRATIHLVASEDLPWLTSVIGPLFARKFRKRWLDIGLTPDILDRTMTGLTDVLAAGPATRGQIMAGLLERGIAIPDADSQAPSHVLLHATGLGLLCRGPDRGREATFTLLDQWLPNAPAGPRGDEALTELARRFFAAFSPATAADFTTWSGLPSTRAIGLIRDELTLLDVGGRVGYTLGAVPPQRGLRLLAAYDNYLVGYRDRELIIDRHRRASAYVGGVIRPTVLLDGRVVGIWRLVRAKKAATIAVTPFARLPSPAMAAIEAERADIERFIELPTELVTG